MSLVNNNSSFIARAKIVHSDKYNYDKAIYINSKTSVKIICPVHGKFSQAPSNHLQGKGCLKCANSAQSNRTRKSTVEFIAEANNVHGYIYDYSKVEYKRGKDKVEIICPEHGIFLQQASNHLSGNGCPDCGFKISAAGEKWTLNKFTSEAIKVHGDKFDYSSVDYKSALQKVIITCPVHGKFEQTPSTHLRAVYGCPKCSNSSVNNDRKITTAQFTSRAIGIHGNKYDYSKVNVIDGKLPVIINCPIHGEFSQGVQEHLSGKGCRQCGFESTSKKLVKSLEKFVLEARLQHGDKFDYSQVDYKSSFEPVKIVCPTHGLFEQLPHTHLKAGCRKCADENLVGYYTDELISENPEIALSPATVYYIQFSSENKLFFKVGITVTTIKERFSGYAKTGYEMYVLKEKKTTLKDAYQIEQKIIIEHGKNYPYKPMNGNRGDRFAGHTECFEAPLPAALVGLFR